MAASREPASLDNVRVTTLRAKEIDIADELSYPVVTEASQSRTEFSIVAHEASVRREITIPPFHDTRVRQAIAYATKASRRLMRDSYQIRSLQ